MIAVLAVLSVATTPIAYSFPSDWKQQYDLSVQLDGFIPVFGGQTADVKVELLVEVRGKGKTDDGKWQASSEIKDMTLTFNGAPLPLPLSTVTDVFPLTTVQVSSEGKVLKSDAPNKSLPVRLPGLDPKRFPEITYLPLEFPSDGFEIGKSWTFQRKFGDGDVTYTATPKEEVDGVIAIDVKVEQTYTNLEDEAMAVVEKEVDAVSRVATHLSGTGVVKFDRNKGRVISVRIEAQAHSVAKDLKTGKETERDLKTIHEVKVHKEGKVR